MRLCTYIYICVYVYVIICNMCMYNIFEVVHGKLGFFICIRNLSLNMSSCVRGIWYVYFKLMNPVELHGKLAN